MCFFSEQEMKCALGHLITFSELYYGLTLVKQLLFVNTAFNIAGRA